MAGRTRIVLQAGRAFSVVRQTAWFVKKNLSTKTPVEVNYQWRANTKNCVNKGILKKKTECRKNAKVDIFLKREQTL